MAVGPELHFRGPENLGSYILECIDLWNALDGDYQELKKDKHYKNAVNFIIRSIRYGIDIHVLRDMIQTLKTNSVTNLESFKERTLLINCMGNYHLENTKAKRWGIKIMKDIKIANKYLEIWPKAQFIHIVRDGRDVAASQMCDHSSWGYKNIEDAANGWVDLIKKARINTNGQMLEIRYEDLINKPENSIEKILSFLSLDWEGSLLEHQRFSHSLYKNAYNHPSIDTVVKPMNNSAIGRYMRDLCVKDQEKFFALAYELLEEFDYMDSKKSERSINQ
ncbi:Sulfotransferase family protein [Tindallia magadiensis]|uniref:Sulfotransferase family protein n=1 Tax=Tindallia magadiensis TaxID=69895 RepID=A0A1I3D3N0_9FIRM|nr:Sulfotransferase family protein [Tindallia magadiensis]